VRPDVDEPWEQQASIFKAEFASMSAFAYVNENDQMKLFFIFLLARTMYHVVFAQSTFFIVAKFEV
jgi:hypothetical protein